MPHRWIVLSSLMMALLMATLAAQPPHLPSDDTGVIGSHQPFPRYRFRTFPELFELSGSVMLDPSTNRPQLTIQAKNISGMGVSFLYHHSLSVFEVDIRRDDGSRVDVEALKPVTNSGSERTLNPGETSTSILSLERLFNLSDPATYQVTIRFRERLIDPSSDFAAGKDLSRQPKNRGVCHFLWRPKSMTPFPIIPGLDVKESTPRVDK